MPSISIPISVGELIDKLTILEIKHERIRDPAKRSNVERELRTLTEIWHASACGEVSVEPERQRLKAVNAELWDIEDRIRGKEAREEFDEEFIRLARSIYRLNDRRAGIKRALNAALGSELIEEKSYAGEPDPG